MRKQMSTCKRRKRSQGLKGSLNPSKRHRDRFNIELDNLAKLLPFSQDVICKLDKLSILRLSASYLRAKNFFKDISKQNVSFPTILGEKKNSAVERLDTENGSLQFSDLLLEALDGFIMVLTNDAEIFYISETVQEYLGLTQASVIHQDFLRFIHVDDHHMISDSLKPNPQKQKKDKDNKSDIKNNILKPFGNEEENEKADNEKDKCDMEQLELAEKESIKIEQEEKRRN